MVPRGHCESAYWSDSVRADDAVEHSLAKDMRFMNAIQGTINDELCTIMFIVKSSALIRDNPKK